MEQRLSIKHENLILLLSGVLFLVCTGLFAFTNNYFFLAPPFALLLLGWSILNWKSLFYFLLFCIPVSIDVTIIDGKLSTSFPDEQLMWLFTILLLFIAVTYKRWRLPEWFLRNSLTFIIALQMLWLMVAVVFSEDFELSFKYLLGQSWLLISFLLFPVMIFREKKDFIRAFWVFAIPFIAYTIFVFSWHATHHFGYWESNRVVLPFYMNHVDYSTALSMFFPLLLVCFQLARHKFLRRLLLLLLIVFYIAAIGVAGSRAAMLGVFFALFIAFAIRRRIVNWIMPIFYGFIIAIVILLAGNNRYYDYRPDMKYTATQQTFTETVVAMFRGTDMSSMERFYRWIAAVRMSQDRPLTGVGPNNFYDYYKNYAVTAFKTWVSRNEERSTTHNYYLFMLVEQGWPAMLLYALLIPAVLAQAQKTYYLAKDPFYKKVTMGLVMVFAAGFINNFFSELIDTHKIGAMFYIAIALLIVVRHIVTQQNKNDAQPPVLPSADLK